MPLTSGENATPPPPVSSQPAGVQDGQRAARGLWAGRRLSELFTCSHSEWMRSLAQEPGQQHRLVPISKVSPLLRRRGMRVTLIYSSHWEPHILFFPSGVTIKNTSLALVDSLSRAWTQSPLGPCGTRPGKPPALLCLGRAAPQRNTGAASELVLCSLVKSQRRLQVSFQEQRWVPQKGTPYIFLPFLKSI